MSPERRRLIASQGGKAVKPENRSFSRDPLLASEAGRKGGLNVEAKKRAFSVDRDLARAAGKKGGAAKSRGENE